MKNYRSSAFFQSSEVAALKNTHQMTYVCARAHGKVYMGKKKTLLRTILSALQLKIEKKLEKSGVLVAIIIK